MNNSELTAYNYGRRVAQAAVQAAAEGRGDQYLPECVLSPQEQSSLERLGQDRWWRFVLQGGNQIVGESDAVPPLPT